MSTSHFQWVEFFRELSEKLQSYKDNRPQLAKLALQIFADAQISPPKLEANHDAPDDIDPFTVIGIFNKRYTPDNRRRLASAAAGLFGLQTPVPTAFSGVPTLNNQNATFYYFKDNDKRGADDISNLWRLFEATLAWALHPTNETREEFARYYDIAIHLPGNACPKITKALFWIAPEQCISLNWDNRQYIYTSGNFSETLQQSLPGFTDKMPARDYLEFVEKLGAYLRSGTCTVHSFVELSAAASERARESSGEQEPQQDDAARPASGDSGDSGIETAGYPPYGRSDFLNEVYMRAGDYDMLIALLERKQQVIRQGAPGVGKTFTAKRLAWSFMGVRDASRVMMVQFHQSYSYEDFIMGFRPAGDHFELRPGPFYSFCKQAESDQDNRYFVIIDEINRGNISKIFGELFMLIESDKRGDALKLLYSDEQFSIPKNLYLIGTMNTADRSLAILDYALRRRFAFFDMPPAFASAGFRAYLTEKDSSRLTSLVKAVERLNEAIAGDASLGRGYRIGHSYFQTDKSVDTAWLESVLECDLLPLLAEYWYDEPGKAADWERSLREAIR